MTNLLPQTNNSREISPQQEQFLTNLFENGGNVTDAALSAGYSKGSVTWLKNSLADEIINRPKNVLSMHANVQAVHGIVLLPPKKEVVIDG